MIAFPLPILLMRALGALAMRPRIVEQPRSLALLDGLSPALFAGYGGALFLRCRQGASVSRSINNARIKAAQERLLPGDSVRVAMLSCYPTIL